MIGGGRGVSAAATVGAKSGAATAFRDDEGATGTAGATSGAATAFRESEGTTGSR